jgi:Right handed beta helix region
MGLSGLCHLFLKRVVEGCVILMIERIHTPMRQEENMKKITVLILMLAAACLLNGCHPAHTSTPVKYVAPTWTLRSTSDRSATLPPIEYTRIVESTLIPTEPRRIEELTPTPTFSPVVIATYVREAIPTLTKAYPTATPTPIVTPYVECQFTYISHLYLGAHAVVSRTPPKANRLRTEPGTQGGDSTVIGWIEPGEEIVLLQGPTCVEGWAWWKVTSISTGQSGWTSEGDGENYWLVPLHPESADSGLESNTITLTADQLDSADDIEAATKRATTEGTRPGTVILDGRNGAFVFTGADRSLNIFVSNLTLRGVNQAVIKNCGDGLFFDNLPLKNILVEGIEFVCEGSGVAVNGAFENVALYNNIFRAKRIGIGMGGASRDWLIAENVIEADQGGIEITGAEKIVITDNHIFGNTGIILRQCSRFQVQKNDIQAAFQGVRLVQESSQNWVQMNTIVGVSHSGIALESGVTGNQILANRVSCAPGKNCSAVDATPEVAEMNTISPISESVENIAYSNDFENSAGKEWSRNNIANSPTGGKFLGQFGNDGIILNLTNLSEHTEIRVVFELYIIRSWDGNTNPDTWQFKVDGQPLLLTTFDNQDYYSDHFQAYPDKYGEGSHPPRTGAKENNTLGYKFDGRPMDAIYVFSFTIPHSSTNLELAFSANGLTPDFSDEGWGIDNVAVYTIK